MYPCAFFTSKTPDASVVFLNIVIPVELVEVIVSPPIVILLSTSKVSTLVVPPTLKKYPLSFALPIPTSALVQLPNLILLELLEALLTFKIMILPSPSLALVHRKLLLMYLHCAVPSLIVNVGSELFEILHNEIPLEETGKKTVSLLNIVAPSKNTCL